jgi:hypothetical protein
MTALVAGRPAAEPGGRPHSTPVDGVFGDPGREPGTPHNPPYAPSSPIRLIPWPTRQAHRLRADEERTHPFRPARLETPRRPAGSRWRAVARLMFLQLRPKIAEANGGQPPWRRTTTVGLAVGNRPPGSARRRKTSRPPTERLLNARPSMVDSRPQLLSRSTSARHVERAAARRRVCRPGGSSSGSPAEVGRRPRSASTVATATRRLHRDPVTVRLRGNCATIRQLGS